MFLLNSCYFTRSYLAEATDGSLDSGTGGALGIEERIGIALSGDEYSNEDGELDGEGGQDLPEDGDNEPDLVDDINDDDSLAKYLGLDEDKISYAEDGSVVFNAVVDGEIKPVKIADLVKSYQLEGHVTTKSMKLEADRREFESQRDVAYTKLAEKLESANGLISFAEKSLLQEFEGIDWQTLRINDPAEWTALRQHYAERANAISHAKAQINNGKLGLTDEQKREEEAKRMEFTQKEINKMVIDNPSWADQEVMAKDVGEIGSFMTKTYGISPEEIASALDARVMRMMRDAHAYHTGKKGLKEKQVPKNIPKFRKPGSQNINHNDMQKARDAKAVKSDIRKSKGNVDSIAKALINRM